MGVLDKVTSRPRTILKTIADIEGRTEEKALNKAIEEYGPIFLQGGLPKQLHEGSGADQKSSQ